MEFYPRLTKAMRRGEVFPVEPKDPEAHIHPRRERKAQCGCGYPQGPCHYGAKDYRGNYCYLVDK